MPDRKSEIIEFGFAAVFIICFGIVLVAAIAHDLKHPHKHIPKKTKSQQNYDDEIIIIPVPKPDGGIGFQFY